MKKSTELGLLLLLALFALGCFGVALYRQQTPEALLELEAGTLLHYGGASHQVVVPEWVGQERVTTIGEGAFWENTHLEQVTLGEGVQNLWEYAFFGCGNLTHVELPASVTNIGAGAFERTGLEEITLGEGLIYLGDGAFSQCPALTGVSVSRDNPYYASVDGILFNRAKTQLILYPQGKTDPCYQVPDGVESLYFQAFSQNTHLHSLVVPSSVTSITGGMFQDCPNLTLYGTAGSYVEDYARREDIPFQTLDSHPVSLTPGVVYTTYNTQIPDVTEDTTLHTGRLPNSLGLYPDGKLFGVAKETGSFSFVVNTHQGEAAYTLAIQGPETGEQPLPMDHNQGATLALPGGVGTLFQVFLNGNLLLEGVDYVCSADGQQVELLEDTLAPLDPGTQVVTLHYWPLYPELTAKKAYSLSVYLTKKQETTRQPAEPFTDVDPGHWFYDPVVFAYKSQSLTGVTPELFQPDSGLTRGMMATTLYALAGRPVVEPVSLPDVTQEQWFSDGVFWLVERGIAQAEAFRPDDLITREEAALLLYRFCQAQELVLPLVTSDLPQDLDRLPEASRQPVTQLFARNMFAGDAEGNFQGDSKVTRSELSVMLRNVMTLPQK